eukprot:1192311-Prorocentrum_minimum.AAC.3
MKAIRTTTRTCARLPRVQDRASSLTPFLATAPLRVTFALQERRCVSLGDRRVGDRWGCILLLVGPARAAEGSRNRGEKEVTVSLDASWLLRTHAVGITLFVPGNSESP